MHRYVDGFKRDDFTREFYPFIKRITRGTGILPGTLLGVAILESSGNGLVGGSGLSRKANNYFGIKCGSSWTGKKYYVNQGSGVSSCFREYPSVEASMKDFVNLVTKNARYANVLKQRTVFDQAKALRDGGYDIIDNYPNLVHSAYTSQKDVISQLGIINVKSNTLVLPIVATAAGIGLLLILTRQNAKTGEVLY